MHTILIYNLFIVLTISFLKQPQNTGYIGMVQTSKREMGSKLSVSKKPSLGQSV